MVSYGAVLALLMLAAAAHWIAGVRREVAFLFGALTCVTGPTVITPLLRTLRPTARIANALRWKGIILDPVGALFAVLVFEAIVTHQQGHSLAVFGATVGIGAAIGLAVAAGLALLLYRQMIPEYLQTFGTLIAVLGAFTLANQLAHESGPFGWPDFVAQNGADAVLLFGVEPNGQLQINSSCRRMEPRPGWRVIALVPPQQGTRVDAAAA